MDGRTRWWATAVVATLAACGDNDVPQGVIQSGTRVRAMSFVDAAGLRIPRGWFDRELGVACEWSGGDQPICVPLYPVAARTSTFSDAACTQPLVPVFGDACAGPRPTYATISRGACEDGVIDEVWTVSDAVVRPQTVFGFSTLGQSCTPSPAQDEVTYHTVGVRLGRGHFAQGEVAHAGRGRIRTRTVVSADGAQAPVGAYDADLEAPCELVGGLGCAPPAYGTSYAEDDACTRPVVVASTTCPLAFVAVDGAGIHRRGARISSDETQDVAVYSTWDPETEQGGVCRPTTVSLGGVFGLYRAEAPVSLAPVALRPGAGQLIAPVWRESGAHRELAALSLPGLGVDCEPAEVAPGAWRCVPSLDRVWRSAYGDAGCTDPIAVAVALGTAAPPGLPAIAFEGGDGCGHGAVAHGYQAGAARAPGTTFVRAGECMPAPTSLMGWDLSYRDVVGDASLDIFPVLTPIVE